MVVHARHAETNLRLVHRRRRQALRALDHGSRGFCGEFLFPDPAGYDADADVAGAPAAGLALRPICTATSVLGGMLGYAIGALLYDSIGHWLIISMAIGDKVAAFRAGYAEYGAWIILLKGLTPIPYKLVTITSGFANYNIWLFIVLSIDRARWALFHGRDPAQPLRRMDPGAESKSGWGCGWRSAPPCWCSVSSSRSG